MSFVLFAGLLGFLTVALLITQKRKSSNDLKPLPGPRGIPYVGVPHKISLSTPFLRLHEWSKTYGPIYQTQVMGDQIVVVTSRKIFQEFLLKNKVAFGNRPSFPGIPWNGKDDMSYIGMIKQADRSRNARQIAGTLMSAMPREQLISTTLRAARDMVLAVQANPNNAKLHTESFASRVGCEMVWGDDSIATAIQNGLVQLQLSRRVALGGCIESKMPFLQYLPDFLQPWKRHELERRAWERRIWEAQRQKGIKATKDKGVWTMAAHAAMLESQGKLQYPDPKFMQPGVKGDMTDMVGALGMIGGKLLAVPVQNYLLAMCHYPQWQAKAGAELDRVCPRRLPVPSDFPRLPIVRAIIREVNRWRPAIPLGAPHCSEVDQEFEGRLIPANSIVVLPIWTLERDPELYPDADSFRPERWLEKGWPTFREPLTEFPKMRGDVEFGWGARMCPGADYSSLVDPLLIAALMKTTVVGKRKDAVSGTEIEIPTMNYEPGSIFVQLYPWQMEARPRSVEALDCLEKIA